jgi:hypothetical protein
MMRNNGGQLSQSEINAILASSSNPLSRYLPAAADTSLYGLGMGLSQPTLTDPALSANSAAARQVLLNQLMQQQQEEEQQRMLLLQRLAALQGFPSAPPPMDNHLALLLQQRQFQQEMALGRSSGLDPRQAFLGGGGGGGGGQDNFPGSSLYPSGAFGAAASAARSPNHLEQLALANLLQSRQELMADTAAAHTASLPNLSNAASTASAAASLPTDADAATQLPVDHRRRKGRTGTFPQKLHQMLTDLERQEGGSEIASFLPHGRAFAIHKPRDFVKHVMPKYFRMGRFSSFQRQLNLYDFQRITEGPDKGGYYHNLFVRGRPIMATMMKRNKIKGVKNLQNKAAPSHEDAEDHSHESDDDEDA